MPFLKAKFTPIILLIIVLLFYFYTGMKGIDFGTHWDEYLIMGSIQKSAETGVWLPGWYNYPSVSYDLGMSTSLAYAFLKGNFDQASIGQFIKRLVDNSALFLRVRVVFLAITLLGVVWVFLLVYHWHRSRWEAFIAAGLLASSWELAYHARWVAPDAILMQFAALTMLCVVQAWQSEKRQYFWLILAAISAGLSLGSKYPGGLLILPVLLTLFLMRKIRPDKYELYLQKSVSVSFLLRLRVHFRSHLLKCIFLIVIFAGAFLLTTPGMVLQPTRFQGDLGYEMQHYSQGHRGFTVTEISEHSPLVLTYLALVAFSPYWPAALFVFILALVGIYVLIRDNKYQALVFLTFPMLYFLYFSLQRVMFVRNYLVLFPFMAVLAGHGASFITHLFQRRSLQYAFTILLAALLVLNFTWQFIAARSVQFRQQIDPVHDTISYIQNHPETQFALSPATRILLPEEVTQGLSNLVSDPLTAQVYIIVNKYDQFPKGVYLMANQPGRYTLISGELAVNYDYYPNWPELAVLGVLVEEAKQMRLIQ